MLPIDPNLREAINISNEVENMLYTVKDIASLANITIKTLYHYHKIGLLVPCKISEAGYRLYGIKELERLQEILFYRELDFPLKEIKQILDGNPDRLSILSNQKNLLQARIKRMEKLVQTIDQSIQYTAKGEIMDQSNMFNGFRNRKEWNEALSEQKKYLKETYNYDGFEENSIQVEKMNEQAIEAKHFMETLAKALKDGLKFDTTEVQTLIEQHIRFLNKHGHLIAAKDFAAQARFFLQDDFHRNMLESQQTGLSYYLCIAAEEYAAN